MHGARSELTLAMLLPPPAMVISIYQVNKVEARKGGGGSEYHAGKVVKYLGYKDFDISYTYLVQFEDNTEENVNGDRGGRLGRYVGITTDGRECLMVQLTITKKTGIRH